MIITLTPNPSTDATMHIASTLAPGGVNRAASVTTIAGGKGVNVSRAAHLAGIATVALFPAHERDPFLSHIAETGINYHAVPITDPVRVNTTITEQDGRTTKINGPGPALENHDVDALHAELLTLADRADAVVMAGSLPRGIAPDFYSATLHRLRATHPHLQIAVDTSDAAMEALGAGFTRAAPDVIKPNGLELGQLVGTDGLALERAAEDGEFGPVVKAALSVVDRGVSQVLVTLGAAGAVLATATGVWRATPAPVTVRSTVGAGDSSLAGFILASLENVDYPERLRRAVAYGTAAAGLPGTTIPSPDQLDLAGTQVYPVNY